MSENEKTKVTHEPHDKGYKRSLSRPKEFLHFLKKYVGADWMILDTDKAVRERKDFQLPTMVPIVFYNGENRWTAARRLCDYQKGGELFGSHILNLEYYLVNLSDIDKEDILSTNTVIDNIMYCDKFREKLELADAVRTAYDRIRLLENQEKEEFNNWVKNILLSICGNREAVVEEILNWAGNGVDDMAFKYNIIKAFEDERAEGVSEGIAQGIAQGITQGIAQGRTEDIIELLEELGDVPAELRETITAEQDLDLLKVWHKKAARVASIEEFVSFLQEENAKE